MAFSDPKSQILCFVFIPRKHAAADRTALHSTRPTCPRWRPTQRRARWGPPCGRSSPPLSSCQLRSAEMTSCYSSSSADHHPPEKELDKNMRSMWEEEEGWWWRWESKNIRRESGKERNKRWKQHLEKSVYQSVSEIRQIYLLAQRNRICLNLHLTQSPEDRRRRQALTHFISQQRVGGLSVSLISAAGAANSRSASGKNLEGRWWWWWSLRVGWLFLSRLGCVCTFCMTIFVRANVRFMHHEYKYFGIVRTF